MSIKPLTYAIGDIHGCSEELDMLLQEIDPNPEDTIVFLGDYVDRGPNSRQVIDKIIETQSVCKTVVLKGNHEQMMLDAIGPSQPDKSEVERMSDIMFWHRNGAEFTLSSYGITLEELHYERSFTDEVTLPDSLKTHLEFLSSLDTFYETDTHIFTHASLDLLTPAHEQPEEYLIWRRTSSIDEMVDYKHNSGKKVVCGHTSSATSLPILLSDDYVIIDTGCCFNGWLTAICVDDGSFIQGSVKRARKLNRQGQPKKIADREVNEPSSV